MKYYLRTKTDSMSYPQLWWCGDGWWSRRKDQAKAFDTHEAAVAEMTACVSIEAMAASDSRELELEHAAG